VTLCAQRPKVNPFIPKMVAVLSEVMDVAEEDISIKATTTEKLGFVGTEEGIAAHAVALIYRVEKTKGEG
jgi:2-C-methyl-D-erythritol 2,4-cyclodiphosphate synthase